MIVSIDRLVYPEAVSLSVIILMFDSVIFTVLGLVLSVCTRLLPGGDWYSDT
jgi:hypothetical protein